MALADPTRDPVNEDVERALADPDILASLEQFERDLADGNLEGMSDAEARQTVGVDPLPGPDHPR